MVVRRLLHALGYRYRVHLSDLPGSPDIAFPGRRMVIFVHGCFWHRHAGCPRATVPQTNTERWQRKFEANTRRDELVRNQLEAEGWKVLVIWECETRESEALIKKLTAFLGPSRFS
ncbi:very short patch repair endonuclease [Desulfocurvibacter africanus]|uniref:very short patch repair endonuclease n=1 Tax=Desulfocurvibacter africanus TaxID=873 RepID=UPI002FDB3833